MDELNKENLNEDNTALSNVGTPVREHEKKNRNMIKFIIPAAVLVILVLILVGVAAATGVLGNKNRVIARAIGKTFSRSAGAIGEAWLTDDCKGMFAEKKIHMDADLTVADMVQMEMQINADKELYGAHMDIGYYGMSLVEAELYIDEEAVMLGAPNLTDYVFYVDRTTFEEDIDRFIAANDLDEEIAEYLKAINTQSRDLDNADEEMEAAVKQLRDAAVDMMNGVKIKKVGSKKLTVNGGEKSCKGYLMTITGEQLADLVLAFKEIYEENETFRNYENELLARMMGYASVEAFLEYEDPAKALREAADELAEQSDTDIYFYIYRDVLAQIYIEDEGVVLEWNIYGGNFPLENTELSISSDYSESSFTRSGGMDGNVYQARYEFQDDYEEITFEAKRDKGNGDFSLELDDGYSLMFLEGNLREKTPGAEIEISIDTFEIDEEEILFGDITVSNECEEIEKPEGKIVDVMDMTEDDWYEILREIVGSLYQIGE